MQVHSDNRWNADLYDAKHSFVWKQGAALLELLAPRAGERILDVGCGTGHLTAQIAAAGAEVVGIDQSAAMIEPARRAYPNIRFEIADARQFAFPEPFDGVFSNAALHWVTEPERVIDCVYRSLKPGGRFVVEFGGKGNIREIVVALYRTAEAMDFRLPPLPWYFPSVAEYASLLEKGGLEVTYALLFDRPTPLEGEQGMRHWIEMFGQDLLTGVPPARLDEYLQQVQDYLRPRLHQNGSWFADYRRLRVVARRQSPEVRP